MVAGLADGGSRIARRPRHRVDVGDDLGRGAFDALPARENVLQELDIFGRVDGGDRTKPGIFRALDRQAGGPRPGKQPLDALRLLRIGLRRAAGEERLRIVAFLFVGKIRLHDVLLARRGQRLEGLAIGGMDLLGVGADKAEPWW